MTLLSLNPANGTLLRSYDALSAEAVTGKIADARLAFEQYSETPLDHRVMWMKKLAGILEQEMEELATLLTTETGKTIRSSREEVLQCAACCRYFAENAAALLEDETVDLDANRCTTVWQPMGVLFAVMQGSNPFWQAFRVAVPALLGGNAVMLKHASNVPQCVVEMELLLRRAGFARGVFQTLLMESNDVEIVLNDERIAAGAIMGMQQAGREMAAHMAWMGKKAVTDDAANGAFIVMPSANLFAAIQAAVAARCVDNGQSNASMARFIVHESVYDEFAPLFASAMEDVKIGNPLKDETELGPMATEASVIRLKAQIASAVAAGGSVLTGGEPMLGDGNYFEPTVLVELPMDAEVCREEIHGPVALLFKVASVQDAIRLANRACGSGVSVWTQDEAEKTYLGRGLACGSVFINSPMVMDARMASGGLKGAGCGRAMAASSLRDFMIARTVVTTGLMAGSEFSFDLSLAEFEKEARLAETVEEPEEVTEPQAFTPAEFEIEDDLFVMSTAAGIKLPSPVIDVSPAPEAVPLPVAVALLVEPDVEEVPPVVAGVSHPAVREKVIVQKKTSTRKKTPPPRKAVAPNKTAVYQQTAIAEMPVPTKPIVMEDLVMTPQEVVALAEVASQSAAPSFKEMFERALMVRA